MKMSSSVCCDTCFDFIAQQNLQASKLWLKLCDIQSTCIIFGLRIEDNPLLQLLENERFITTTDTPECIVVKVHGRSDADGYFFCGGHCEKQ